MSTSTITDTAVRRHAARFSSLGCTSTTRYLGGGLEVYRTGGEITGGTWMASVVPELPEGDDWSEHLRAMGLPPSVAEWWADALAEAL